MSKQHEGFLVPDPQRLLNPLLSFPISNPRNNWREIPIDDALTLITSRIKDGHRVLFNNNTLIIQMF